MEQIKIIGLEKNYLMNSYNKPNFVLDHGMGCYLWDKTGKKYLDMIGSIATCSVGHANSEIVQAMVNQAVKLTGTSNLYYTEPQALLAEKLTQLSGMDKCFFSNSGSEAIETAIKLAKKHTKKSKIIAMQNGFHGRTHASLSATWNPKYKKSFQPLVQGFVHVPYNNIEALKDLIDKETAAIILEPIQGEAGVVIPNIGYLKAVEELCKKNGALLIVDEVQTGNGRTGNYFCYQNEGIIPDIVAVAKGIANGMPLAATLAKGIDFDPGDHGSTFGGNSLCCAAALATIKIIEKHMPQAVTKGEYLMTKLNLIDSFNIKEVRGKGLMIAIELNKEDSSLVNQCYANGLLVNVIGNKIIRMLPLLTITTEEMDNAVKILDKILGDDS